MEKAYSFTNVQLSISTAERPGYVVEGWAAGESVVRISRVSDTFAYDVSIEGKLIPLVSRNKVGIISFDVKNNSDTNHFMYDEVAKCQAGAFAPVFVSISEVSTGEAIAGALTGGINSLFGTSFGNPLGGSGGFKLTDAKAVIRKPADMTKGSTLGTTTWELIVDNMLMETESTSNALTEALGTLGQLANVF